MCSIMAIVYFEFDKLNQMEITLSFKLENSFSGHKISILFHAIVSRCSMLGNWDCLCFKKTLPALNEFEFKLENVSLIGELWRWF